MNFSDAVLQPIREHLGRSVSAPSRVAWSVKDLGASGLELGLRAPLVELAQDFQTPIPASPAYLLCFGYWLERATGRSARCRVRVEGEAPRVAPDSCTGGVPRSSSPNTRICSRSASRSRPRPPGLGRSARS